MNVEASMPAKDFEAENCWKKTTRKYSDAAGKSVEREMKAKKKGTLKSGSGKKVKSNKQAIAIGLSKARKAGKKVSAKKA
jgi:hypothetical protein